MLANQAFLFKKQQFNIFGNSTPYMTRQQVAIHGFLGNMLDT